LEGTVQLEYSNVFETLDVANQYGVNNLKDMCARHIKANISVDEVCGILEAAELYNCEELVSKAKEFIIENATQVFRSHTITTLSKASLISLLHEEGLCAAELTIFEGVTMWGNAHQNEIQEVISLVRFALIDPNSLVDVVQPSGTPVFTSLNISGVVPLELLLEAHVFHSTGRLPQDPMRRRKRVGTMNSLKWNNDAKGDGILLLNSFTAQLNNINHRFVLEDSLNIKTTCSNKSTSKLWCSLLGGQL
jgi:hypothetical protein